MGHARSPSVSRHQACLLIKLASVEMVTTFFTWRYGNECFFILRKFDFHKELFMEIDCDLNKWKTYRFY